jgi:hypothetical protein
MNGSKTNLSFQLLLQLPHTTDVGRRHMHTHTKLRPSIVSSSVLALPLAFVVLLLGGWRCRRRTPSAPTNPKSTSSSRPSVPCSSTLRRCGRCLCNAATSGHGASGASGGGEGGGGGRRGGEGGVRGVEGVKGGEEARGKRAKLGVKVCGADAAEGFEGVGELGVLLLPEGGRVELGRRVEGQRLEGVEGHWPQQLVLELRLSVADKLLARREHLDQQPLPPEQLVEQRAAVRVARCTRARGRGWGPGRGGAWERERGWGRAEGVGCGGRGVGRESGMEIRSRPDLPIPHPSRPHTYRPGSCPARAWDRAGRAPPAEGNGGRRGASRMQRPVAPHAPALRTRVTRQTPMLEAVPLSVWIAYSSSCT